MRKKFFYFEKENPWIFMHNLPKTNFAAMIFFLLDTSHTCVDDGVDNGVNSINLSDM